MVSLILKVSVFGLERQSICTAFDVVMPTIAELLTLANVIVIKEIVYQTF